MYLSKYNSTREPKLPEEHCQIATNYDFNYEDPPYKYQFCANTMNIYSREPIEILLDAILLLLMLNDLINEQHVEKLWKILTKNTPESNKQILYDIALTLVDKYVNFKDLIQNICFDIIFQRFDAALVIRAKKDLREMIEKGHKFLDA